MSAQSNDDDVSTGDGATAVVQQVLHREVSEPAEIAVVWEAAGAVGVRHCTTSEVAYAMLCGLARSQDRDLEEYAALVVASGGRLDV